MASLVTTEVVGATARVMIKRDPVNSMNLELWTELLDTLLALEKRKDVKGAIFYSGLTKRVYTAGNDINELCATRTSKERFSKFWNNQNEFLARLYMSPLVTVAAIRGQCPAGGCALALMCDFRVIARDGNPKMGLNEVALGINPPKYWAKVMQRTVGYRNAELLLNGAMLADTDMALRMGLVDEVVGEADLLAAADAMLAPQLKLPALNRAMTKRATRLEISEAWLEELPSDIGIVWQSLTTPMVVKKLEAVLARLSGASSSKAKL